MAKYFFDGNAGTSKPERKRMIFGNLLSYVLRDNDILYVTNNVDYNLASLEVTDFEVELVKEKPEDADIITVNPLDYRAYLELEHSVS